MVTDVRGEDRKSVGMFSYVRLEERVPRDRKRDNAMEQILCEVVARDVGEFVTSADMYEILYKGSLNSITNWNATIIMREKDPRQGADGRWVRTYGFADGHTELHAAAGVPAT